MIDYSLLANALDIVLRTKSNKDLLQSNGHDRMLWLLSRSLYLDQHPANTTRGTSDADEWCYATMNLLTGNISKHRATVRREHIFIDAYHQYYDLGEGLKDRSDLWSTLIRWRKALMAVVWPKILSPASPTRLSVQLPAWSHPSLSMATICYMPIATSHLWLAIGCRPNHVSECSLS